MTVVLELGPEIEEALERKAKASGFEVSVYLEKLVQKDVEAETEKSFAEILAPIQKVFQESGMSEDELVEMFENAREEVWREKQTAK